jgi:glycerol-3-phosphate dehydrogenase
MERPAVLIIGAGFTGMAAAYDLAQRGCDVTVVERGEIASGTSGRTHGLLHSGGRYCVKDKESAVECIEENTILRKIIPYCIEPNGGFFVALNESDLAYAIEFEKSAQECKIPIEKFSGTQVRKIEPAVSERIILAYSVPDGTFDPLRLAWGFGAGARQYGAKFLTYHEVDKIDVDGNSKVAEVHLTNRANGGKKSFKPDMVVNATGAWAGRIASLAGIEVDVKPTPGVMVAVNQRLTQTVINRLNKPDDGDIVLPQRRMVVIGTTSFDAEDVDYIPMDDDQTKMMIDRGSEMIPGISKAQYRGVYMSSRPLIGASMAGRSLTRTFKTLDHEQLDGLKGMVSIIGGKATTCRAMAEQVTDMVCKKLGITEPCGTKEVPLPSYRKFFTSQAGGES